jgi:hypothetical protein
MNAERVRCSDSRRGALPSIIARCRRGRRSRLRGWKGALSGSRWFAVRSVGTSSEASERHRKFTIGGKPLSRLRCGNCLFRRSRARHSLRGKAGYPDRQCRLPRHRWSALPRSSTNGLARGSRRPGRRRASRSRSMISTRPRRGCRPDRPIVWWPTDERIGRTAPRASPGLGGGLGPQQLPTEAVAERTRRSRARPHPRRDLGRHDAAAGTSCRAGGACRWRPHYSSRPRSHRPAARQRLRAARRGGAAPRGRRRL